MDRAKTVNMLCPLDGKLVDPDIHREWQGERVGFCCSNCASNWDALPAEEKGERLALIGSQE